LKEDKDMCFKGKKKDKRKNEKLEIQIKTINQFVESKKTIKVKDGIAKIKETHPDYKKWIEN
jgi:hypothetical protein